MLNGIHLLTPIPVLCPEQNAVNIPSAARHVGAHSFIMWSGAIRQISGHKKTVV